MRTKTLAHALLACLLLATLAASSPAQAEEPLAVEDAVPEDSTHSYKTYLTISKNKGEYSLNTVYQGLIIKSLPPVPINDSPPLSSAPEGDGHQTIPIASLDTTPLTPSGYAPLRLILADIPKKADVVAVEVRDPVLGTTQVAEFSDSKVDLMEGEGQNVTAVVSGLWVMPDRPYEVALVAASGLFMESVAQLLTTNEEASDALHSAGAPQTIPTGGGTANPPGTGGGSSSGGCQPRTYWHWNRYLSTGSNFGNTLNANDDDLLNKANGVTYSYWDGCYASTRQNGDFDFGYGVEGPSLRVGTGLWTIFSALDYNGARSMQQSGSSYKGHNIIVDDVHLTMLLPSDLGAAYIDTTNPKQAAWGCSETMPTWFFAALEVVDKTGIVSSVIPDEVCTQKWANYYSQMHNSGPAGGYISLMGSDSAEKHLGAYMIYEFASRGDYVMDMEVKALVDADMRACFGSCGWTSSTLIWYTWMTRDNEIR